MELLIIWIVLATCVGIWAGRRGRSAEAWGAVSLVISPVLAWIILLAIGPVEQ